MISGIPSPIVAVFWTILGILSVLAFLGNGFIAAVIGHQWLQMRKIAPCDFLLASLSTSRFLLQLISLLGYPAYFNAPLSRVYVIMLSFMNSAWLFFDTVNLWCGTWLSIFYCTKVSSVPKCLFSWLKIRIDVILLRLLGMSILVSMVISLPTFVCYWPHNKCYNLTGIVPVIYSQIHSNDLTPPVLVYRVINFILNVIASTLLIISLWKHTRNLRKSSTSLRDLSTEVHIKVIKFVLFYLFFYILSFIAVIFSTTNIFEFGTPQRLLSEILLSAFSSVHSAILILMNPKLKKVFAHIIKIRPSFLWKG